MKFVNQKLKLVCKRMRNLLGIRHTICILACFQIVFFQMTLASTDSPHENIKALNPLVIVEKLTHDDVSLSRDETLSSCKMMLSRPENLTNFLITELNMERGRVLLQKK